MPASASRWLAVRPSAGSDANRSTPEVPRSHDTSTGHGEDGFFSEGLPSAAAPSAGRYPQSSAARGMSGSPRQESRSPIWGMFPDGLSRSPRERKRPTTQRSTERGAG